jgi:hypothetical protein
MATNSNLASPVFETGGESVEIRSLAQKIRSELAPESAILDVLSEGLPPDNYMSDNVQWSEMLDANGIAQESISSQISRVSSYLG